MVQATLDVPLRSYASFNKSFTQLVSGEKDKRRSHLPANRLDDVHETSLDLVHCLNISCRFD